MHLDYVGETQEQAISRDEEFWDSMIKGLPKATDTFTVEQLQDMGLVGLYMYEE